MSIRLILSKVEGGGGGPIVPPPSRLRVTIFSRLLGLINTFLDVYWSLSALLNFVKHFVKALTTVFNFWGKIGFSFCFVFVSFFINFNEIALYKAFQTRFRKRFR